MVTFIRKENSKGLLLSHLKSLPVYDGQVLSRVQLYQAMDKSFCLNMFSFDASSVGTPKHEVPKIAKDILEFASKIMKGEIDGSGLVVKNAALFDNDVLVDYMSQCSPGYLNNLSPRRFLSQRALFAKVTLSRFLAM